MGRVVSSTVILTLTVIVAMAAPAATAQEGRRDKLHGVGRILKDVDYVGDAAYADDRDKLDIYVPASGDAHPVVVFYHGGGLQGGHKSESEHVGQTLAAAGIVAVVPNYRLSPDVAHPAHAEDAAAALAWTHKHIDAHGGDPSRIYLSGHSAGAYLAVLLAMDTRYLKAVGMASSDLAGVIPISGFFYVERVAPDRPKSVWGTEERVWLEASPTQYLKADAPPHLFLYADGDDRWRREQNEEIAQALRALGHKRVEVAEIDNRDHVGIWRSIAPGDPAVERLIAFVKR